MTVDNGYAIVNIMLASLVVLFGLGIFTYKMAGVWEERDYFAMFKDRWLHGIGISIAIAVGVLIISVIETKEQILSSDYPISILGSDINRSIFIMIPLMITVFVMAFSAWTDLWSGHAPSELAWAGIWTSMPFMLVYMFSATDKPLVWVPVLLWGFVAFMLYFNRGLGDADVRLLWLINIATVWWVGLYWSAILFTVAAFLQIVVHALAQKFEWGRLVNIEYKPREIRRREFWAKYFRNIDPTKESRDRRHVPFIPVMAVAWIGGLTVLVVWFPNELVINNMFSIF